MTLLYERLTGAAWRRVAAPIQSVHAARPTDAHGRFRIDHGRHMLARLLVRILQLPAQGVDVDTRLRITACGNGEHWLRTFNGHRLETRQFATDDSALAEQFGILELRFRLETSGDSLVYVQHQAALVFGPVRLTLPAVCAPRVDAREDPAGADAVDVDVHVTLPAIGTLITYQGRIDVDPTHA